jgi:KIF-1 binding protein C terminal
VRTSPQLTAPPWLSVDCTYMSDHAGNHDCAWALSMSPSNSHRLLGECLSKRVVRRSLAMFETDPHRACIMHRQRIKLFAAVEGGQLSYQHFEGLVKSIALEQANASRQIWSIKDGNKWAAPKVAAAQREAVEHHAKYVDLFKVDGLLPDKLEEVWEEHVLTACVTLARAKLQLQV